MITMKDVGEMISEGRKAERKLCAAGPWQPAETPPNSDRRVLVMQRQVLIRDSKEEHIWYSGHYVADSNHPDHGYWFENVTHMEIAGVLWWAEINQPKEKP